MNRDMTKADFEACVKDSYDAMCKIFSETDGVPPTLVLFKMNEDQTVDGVKLLDISEMMQEGDKGKQFLGQLVTKMVADGLADIAAIVSEAWLATAASREEVEGLRPSERPDRQEVVIFSFQSRDYANMAIFPMDRQNKTLVYQEPMWEAEISGQLMPSRPQKH